ncbi:MAG: hypothetical protein WC631_02945 [Candidatus Paceibacterota bacterium]|jgi:hypothetical protein
MDNKIIWHALEYKRKEKTADWYWAVGIISVCIAGIAIFLHDTLFAVFIILAVITLIMFSRREPKVMEVELNDRGLKVDKEHYHYISLESFWVDNTDEKEPKIILRSKKTISPLIVIPIEEYNHEDVRNFLLEKLSEKEMHEPLSQKVMEKLGF